MEETEDDELGEEALESDDLKLVCCCFVKEPRTPTLEELLEKTLLLPVLMFLLLGSENLTCFSGPSEVVEAAADAVEAASSVAEDDIPAKIMPHCHINYCLMSQQCSQPGSS